MVQSKEVGLAEDGGTPARLSSQSLLPKRAEGVECRIQLLWPVRGAAMLFSNTKPGQAHRKYLSNILSCLGKA